LEDDDDNGEVNYNYKRIREETIDSPLMYIRSVSDNGFMSFRKARYPAGKEKQDNDQSPHYS
jgi:hypothetical protein